MRFRRSPSSRFSLRVGTIENEARIAELVVQVACRVRLNVGRTQKLERGEGLHQRVVACGWLVEAGQDSVRDPRPEARSRAPGPGAAAVVRGSAVPVSVRSVTYPERRAEHARGVGVLVPGKAGLST